MSLADEKSKNPTGYKKTRTLAGYVVIEIDHWAHPLKDSEEWVERTKLAYPSLQQFNREQKRSRILGAGGVYYPEFTANGGRQVYVRQMTDLLDSPVYRGWDFGHRFPTCVWAQYDSKNKRLIVLRCLMPLRGSDVHISTATFRDVVLYQSGQRPIEVLNQVGLWLVKESERHRDAQPSPWFLPGIQFIDFAGHEALQESSEVAQETAEKDAAAILQSEGISLNVYYRSVKAREDVMRELLAIRADGHPGLIVDPAAWQVIDMFEGGLTYPKPTARNPLPEKKPHKDGFFDNVNDALGYAAVNIVGFEQPEEEPETTVRAGARGRHGELLNGSGSLFHEGRGR